MLWYLLISCIADDHKFPCFLGSRNVILSSVEGRTTDERGDFAVGFLSNRTANLISCLLSLVLSPYDIQA